MTVDINTLLAKIGIQVIQIDELQKQLTDLSKKNEENTKKLEEVIKHLDSLNKDAMGPSGPRELNEHINNSSAKRNK